MFPLIYSPVISLLIHHFWILCVTIMSFCPNPSIFLATTARGRYRICANIPIHPECHRGRQDISAKIGSILYDTVTARYPPWSIPVLYSLPIVLLPARSGSDWESVWNPHSSQMSHNITHWVFQYYVQFIYHRYILLRSLGDVIILHCGHNFLAP